VDERHQLQTVGLTWRGYTLTLAGMST